MEPTVNVFEAATAQRDEIDAAVRAASADLRTLTDTLAGDAPRVIGLTPDHVKADPRWQQAKARYETLFKALQQFNAAYVKRFKRELAAQRRAKIDA